MKTYAERSCFTDIQIHVWRTLTTMVTRVSKTWGNELRCHELARACLYTQFPFRPELVLKDGKFGPIEHSWLEWDSRKARNTHPTDFTPRVPTFGPGHGVIIDVYTPGRLPQVQILDPFVATRLYMAGVPRTDIRQDIVDQLIREMTGFAPGEAQPY